MVLVGGQALAFWCERYRDRSELGAIPVASRDVDFYVGAKAAKECAAKLRGQIKLAKPFDHSPNSALVTFADSEGEQREIDFLRVVFGLENDEVRKKSLLIEEVHEGECFHIRVLNPIMVLRSRVANVAELPLMVLRNFVPPFFARTSSCASFSQQIGNAMYFGTTRQSSSLLAARADDVFSVSTVSMFLMRYLSMNCWATSS